MNTVEIANILAKLFVELTEGAPKAGGYMLNGSDEGLLRSLDKVSAADASVLTPSGSSIAAHTDHLRYGLSLMNRWSAGENPFEDADWSASWRRAVVAERDWQQLRADLRTEISRWLDGLRKPREANESELSGMIGSIAHLAYHLGAIRQINQATRGPVETIK
jgi:hypothetical protein